MFEVRVTDVKPVDDSSNVGIQFGGATFGTGALGQFQFARSPSGTIEINAQINALVQKRTLHMLRSSASRRASRR